MGIEVEARPFAKSTLQLFRAQLILHDRVRAVFQRSLQFARQTGCLKGRRMKVAVDTTYIWAGDNRRSRWSGHWPNGPGPGVGRMERAPVFPATDGKPYCRR